MLHIYAALAEKERRMISERTKAGLAAAKKRGVKLGGLNAKGVAEQQAARTRAEQLRPVTWASTRRRQGGDMNSQAGDDLGSGMPAGEPAVAPFFRCAGNGIDDGRRHSFYLAQRPSLCAVCSFFRLRCC